MAWMNLGIAKEDVERRTAMGQGSIAMPVTGLPEVAIRLPSCGGCPRIDSHNPCSAIGIRIPHGESTYQRVPIANRPDVDSLNRIQRAMAATGYYAWGYVGDEVSLNAGPAGDNASQTETYEVVGGTGTRPRLRGRNPKRLTYSRTRLNPGFDTGDPDPITGTFGRQVSESFACALPVGAGMEMQAPSVLYGKLEPRVTKIFPPASDAAEDVEFEVQVSADMSNARKPIDLMFPPIDGRYWCKLRFEIIRPDWWKRFQKAQETSFIKRTVELTETAERELVNSGGLGTRVIWPVQMAGAVRVEMFLAAGGSYVLTDEETVAILRQEDPTEDAWRTFIDMSWADMPTTHVRALVTYWCEALSGDRGRIWVHGGCANSQVDPSGSYLGPGGSAHRCVAADSTGFSTFRGARCWKPGSCNQFGIGDAAESRGVLVAGPDDFGDGAWLSGLWHRASWHEEQGMESIAGGRNRTLVKGAQDGVSIAALCGGWRDDVPMGKMPTRRPWNLPVFGQLAHWTDGDGNEHQEIVHGAWYAAPVDYSSTGGPDWRYTAGSIPQIGCVAGIVSGWTTKVDGWGNAMDLGLARLPERLTGSCNVYSYESGGSGMGNSTEMVDVEWVVSGCALDGAEDTEVTAGVRARFA